MIALGLSMEEYCNPSLAPNTEEYSWKGQPSRDTGTVLMVVVVVRLRVLAVGDGVGVGVGSTVLATVLPGTAHPPMLQQHSRPTISDLAKQLLGVPGARI